MNHFLISIFLSLSYSTFGQNDSLVGSWIYSHSDIISEGEQRSVDGWGRDSEHKFVFSQDSLFVLSKKDQLTASFVYFVSSDTIFLANQPVYGFQLIPDTLRLLGIDPPGEVTQVWIKE